LPEGQGRITVAGTAHTGTFTPAEVWNILATSGPADWKIEGALPGARLLGLTAKQPVFQEVGLRGADLRGFESSDGVFKGLDLSRADLRGATFAGGQIAGAELRDAQLDRCGFSNIALTKIVASAIGWRQGHVTGTTITDADLRGATLEHVTIHDSILARVDLRDATLVLALGKAQFVDCDLRGARLSLVLTSAEGLPLTFRRCDLRGVDLSTIAAQGAQSRGALAPKNDRDIRAWKINLSGSQIAQAKLWDPDHVHDDGVVLTPAADEAHALTRALRAVSTLVANAQATDWRAVANIEQEVTRYLVMARQKGFDPIENLNEDTLDAIAAFVSKRASTAAKAGAYR
jgi:uncharacterized protein YjbI with pentapeptide repeats